MKRINPNTAKKIASITLTALGSVGVGVTGYLSAKAGIAVKDIALDEKKTKQEKRREIIKEVIPVGLSAGATIGCIVSSNILSSKTVQCIQTEMAAGYVLLQNAYYQYRKKIDKQTDEKILKEITTEKVTGASRIEEKDPWCDMYHDSQWYATEADVFWAEIHVKELLNRIGRVSLHDFYECLRKERGCDIPYVPNEEDLIWDIDILVIEWDSYDIYFSNLYDELMDGGRFYTLDFCIPPYPSSEIERFEKEYSGG